MKRLLTYLSIGFVFGFFSWSTNSSARGMAASSAEKDYVHLVLNAVEKRNGRKPESKVVNLADFERGFEQYDIAAKLKAEIEFQADTLILAIGENVPDLKTDEAKLKFRDSVSRLLKLLKADRRRCAPRQSRLRLAPPAGYNIAARFWKVVKQRRGLSVVKFS